MTLRAAWGTRRVVPSDFCAFFSAVCNLFLMSWARCQNELYPTVQFACEPHTRTRHYSSTQSESQHWARDLPTERKYMDSWGHFFRAVGSSYLKKANRISGMRASMGIILGNLSAL